MILLRHLRFFAAKLIRFYEEVDRVYAVPGPLRFLSWSVHCEIFGLSGKGKGSEIRLPTSGFWILDSRILDSFRDRLLTPLHRFALLGTLSPAYSVTREHG